MEMPTIEAHYELQSERSNKTTANKEKRETCLPALSARYSKNTSEKKQNRVGNYDFKSFKAPSSVASSSAAKPVTLDVKRIKLNESSSKRLAADNTAMTTAMRTTANTSGGGMPSLIPPKQLQQASENLASGNSRRSRSNKRSTSKSGRGSDLDHVFDEAERKAKARKDALA